MTSHDPDCSGSSLAPPWREPSALGWGRADAALRGAGYASGAARIASPSMGLTLRRRDTDEVLKLGGEPPPGPLRQRSSPCAARAQGGKRGRCCLVVSFIKGNQPADSGSWPGALNGRDHRNGLGECCRGRNRTGVPVCGRQFPPLRIDPRPAGRGRDPGNPSRGLPCRDRRLTWGSRQ